MATNDYFEVQFIYSVYNVKSQSEKAELFTKTENERLRLETYMLDGIGGNKFFVHIDLKKKQ